MAIALQPDLTAGGKQVDRELSDRPLRRSAALRRQQPPAAHAGDRQGAALPRGDLLARQHPRRAARRGGRPARQCLGFRARRQARQARCQDARVHRISTLRPARPRRIARASAIRRSIPRAFCGLPDGPNNRWLSYDTNTEKFLAFAYPRGKGNAGGNSMALHPDGTVWATGGNKEARQLIPGQGGIQVLRIAPTPMRSHFRAPTASRSPATARSGTPRTKRTT